MSARSAWLLAGVLALAGCKNNGADTTTPATKPAGAPADERPIVPDGPEMAAERRALLEELRDQEITDRAVLEAIARVPRHALVPEHLRPLAYQNRPLPIGHEQTISQPYIVALMTQLADLSEGEKVLEVGTGSGYQAAVLAELGAKVHTIEIVEPLAKRARRDLEKLGYANRIKFRIGDGYAGWPEAAPFDAIVVTAAPAKVPKPLIDQLAVGGRLVIPVGEHHQELRLLEKTERGVVDKTVIPVRFVPMTGKAQNSEG